MLREGVDPAQRVVEQEPADPLTSGRGSDTDLGEVPVRRIGAGAVHPSEVPQRAEGTAGPEDPEECRDLPDERQRAADVRPRRLPERGAEQPALVDRDVERPGAFGDGPDERGEEGAEHDDPVLARTRRSDLTEDGVGSEGLGEHGRGGGHLGRGCGTDGDRHGDSSTFGHLARSACRPLLRTPRTLPVMTQDQQTRSYRPRGERRDELLDAAALVVRDHGVTGLTTRAVAERAGVAHGVVHYVFGARWNLVVALLERQARDVLPRVLAAADARHDLADAIDAGVAAYLDLVRREPERFRLLEAVSGTALDGDDALVAAERALWRDGVAAGITRWTARHGVELAEPTAVAAEAVLALVDGLGRAAWGDPDGTSTDRARAVLVRGLAHALTR